MRTDRCCLCKGAPDGCLAHEGKELPICEPCLEDVPGGCERAYILSRLEGTSHNLALMFATGQGPGLQTNKTFMAGHCNGNQFEGKELLGNGYKTLAKQAGLSNLTGKRYLHRLARFPGDPQAWVSDVSDIRRVIEKRPGWEYQLHEHGNVIRGPEAPPQEQVGIAPDILERETNAELAKEGGPVSKKRREEVRERVREDITPWFNKKGASVG